MYKREKRLSRLKTSSTSYLKTDIDVCSVDSWRPPKRKSPIGNLIETGSLGVGELLVLHALLETGGFLPEETFPSREIRPFEERVLQDSFHSTQSLPLARKGREYDNSIRLNRNCSM